MKSINQSYPEVKYFQAIDKAYWGYHDFPLERKSQSHDLKKDVLGHFSS